ncbi:MAG: FHA domain-containing protein [Myxococcales bacterium]
MEQAKANGGAWARLVIVRGDTPRRFLFEAGRPARLVIGSDANASLCLRHPSVAPRHFDAVWDGTNFWLEDALRLGSTTVNGKRLNEWVAILGQAVIALGPIRLWVAAEGPPPNGAAPDYRALDRARLTEALRDPENRQRNTGRITLPPELLAATEKTGA